MQSSWENLKTDRVYTHYHLFLLNLEGDPLPPYVVERMHIIPIQVSRPPQPVFFYIYREEAGLREAQGFVLRHLAGVASMRLLLGVPPSRWWVDVNPTHYGYTPDGEWRRPDETWAIEYDAGYPRSIFIEKMYGMAGRYPHQIWGAPTKERRTYLERNIPPRLREKIRVIHAPWL